MSVEWVYGACEISKSYVIVVQSGRQLHCSTVKLLENIISASTQHRISAIVQTLVCLSPIQIQNLFQFDRFFTVVLILLFSAYLAMQIERIHIGLLWNWPNIPVHNAADCMCERIAIGVRCWNSSRVRRARSGVTLSIWWSWLVLSICKYPARPECERIRRANWEFYHLNAAPNGNLPPNHCIFDVNRPMWCPIWPAVRHANRNQTRDADTVDYFHYHCWYTHSPYPNSRWHSDCLPQLSIQAKFCMQWQKGKNKHQSINVDFFLEINMPSRALHSYSSE